MDSEIEREARHVPDELTALLFASPWLMAHPPLPRPDLPSSLGDFGFEFGFLLQTSNTVYVFLSFVVPGSYRLGKASRAAFLIFIVGDMVIVTYDIRLMYIFTVTMMS